MNSKKNIQFTIITFVIGLMIAVQFQTTKQPIVRDTRDAWELREDIKKEQELQTKILREIRTYDEQLRSYEAEQNNQQVLKDALNDLKKEAGLTELTGNGLVLTVEPLFDESLVGEKVEGISPELLKRLINELNSYNAREISIAGQRVIATTVIRDINGRTKVNDYWLTRFPFEIKVIAKDANRLYNRMQVSNAMDDFAADNLRLTISEPLEEVAVPAYDQVVRIKNMSPVEKE
ncbi:DUF881 domain-containing protein [Bacillus sp. CGMCC 1.16541]|uniref:DUF881 domain-containing protein n=1 Tax=Bacillus sp. CGMCC 1.16541 TaxID=2185143 RepID=UPI000D730334|nr:DUF881 domain-containing protein [Bacillus sp. CGMCC 1.16541]